MNNLTYPQNTGHSPDTTQSDHFLWATAGPLQAISTECSRVQRAQLQQISLKAQQILEILNSRDDSRARELRDLAFEIGTPSRLPSGTPERAVRVITFITKIHRDPFYYGLHMNESHPASPLQGPPTCLPVVVLEPPATPQAVFDNFQRTIESLSPSKASPATITSKQFEALENICKTFICSGGTILATEKMPEPEA